MKFSCLKTSRFAFFSLIALFSACGIKRKVEKSKSTNIIPFANIEQGFKNIPDSVQTSVYWYWISDNISKEGVVKDLHAMKKVGINRAFIGNIGLNEVPYGKVKILSDEWWDIIHAALKTATELNIEIGIFNSPGWSQSGGPWIKPSEAMRYLTSSKTEAIGPKQLSISLQQPAKEFQDVRVIAFPAPKDFEKSISDFNPTITSIPTISDVKNCMDNDTTTEMIIPSKSNFMLDFKTSEPFTTRSITFYPAHRKMKMEADIQAKENGNFKTIKSFTVDRSNDELNVGFAPYAPASISVPETSSKEFRIVFKNVAPDNSGLREIKISSSPRVEDYAEKTLAKMFPTPFPYWGSYEWNKQPEFEEKDLVVDPSKVIDISKYMNADGQLNWNVPNGEWIIMRIGMTPTGVHNSPASPEGTGLEVDKMSKKHVTAHFDAFLGKILERIPAADRKTWKVTVEDSYETGGQNWTDNMIEKFETQFGYNPFPYLPVMSGLVVGSEEKSDRFLWDLRRFVANEVAYQYVAGLREVSHQHGLHTWLENYGHWGFPGTFLMYGGQSDEISGEFWSEGDLGNIENRAASSAAHIYGKTKVSAESFTAGGKTFARYPEMMKQRGDRFFTEGINNTLLHLFIEQPYDDKWPGVNAPFGNEFNRKNTWFYDMDMFLQYIKRCNFMLQQGTYIADVAYFIGEDAPKMTGTQDPQLPKGYSFDYMNAEVIENRMQVKNGRLTLPDGMNYGILVLPKMKTMRPKVLKKIMELVKEGAVVLGPKPDGSPSLENYPEADKEIRSLTKELWGNINGGSIKVNHFGKGMVIDGMNMQEALNLIKVAPDYKTNGGDSTLFIHRKLTDGDIYFISNQTEKTVSIEPTFRVTGKSPELWDAINGSMRDLPAYSFSDGGTSIPMRLAPLESAFVIFRKPANDNPEMHNVLANFPEPSNIQPVVGPWQVNFDPKRGPADPVTFEKLTDWTKRPEESIKYFSGTAVYHNTFKITKMNNHQKVFLDLGRIIAVAKVKINGVEVGGAWTYPYHVDITKAIKSGDNKLEISVTNNWMNRIIGDLNLPKAERKTWLTFNPYKKGDPLQASGLMGPVVLETFIYK